MKILFLTDKFPLERTTVGNIVLEDAKKFVEKGHDVSVITVVQDIGEVGVSEYNGIKIFKTYSNYKERFRSYFSLYNPTTVRYIDGIIKELKPDIVHAHNIHQCISYHCLKIAKKNGAKVFLTAHDFMLFHYGKLVESIRENTSCNDDLNYQISIWQQISKYKKRYNPFRNLIIRYYLRYVDRVFTVSCTLRDALNHNGIRNAEVIYNGINVNDWDVNAFETEKFIEKYNLHGKKIVLFGGRLSREKGGRQAILAMGKVVSEVPEAVLLVMGDKNEYALEMEGVSISKGIEKNLVFTGWISGDERKSAYHVSDILIVPSIYIEPFGMGCIEAMVCKKPSVVTCFGGPKEIVLDNKTGYVTNFFDPLASADKIIDLLKNSTKAEKFGKAGYERLCQEFSLNIHINKTLNYYTVIKRVRPSMPLFLSLKFYLFLRSLRADKIPKIKGLFYFLYNKVKNKHGVMIISTNNKIKLHIDLSDKLISSRLLQYGYWECGLTKLVTKIIRPGMTVIDAGAHVGYYSTLFSKLVGPNGRVFSFEPEHHNFLFLRENIVLNNLMNCTYENKAVYNSNGLIKLNLNSENLGAHSIIEKEVNSISVDIETIRLDDYFKNINTKIDFIKMDIEGAEEFALAGAKNIINENPDIIIVMEFKPTSMNVLKKVRSHGFRVFVVDHGTGHLEEFTNDGAIISYMKERGNALINILCVKNIFWTETL